MLKKIAVGCGKRNYGADWYHVDGEEYPHIDSNDISLYNYEENSADIIYASHLLSYFDYYEAEFFLINWYRVLKSEGVLRLAVPDFNAIADLYMNDPNIYSLDKFIGPLYGKMEMDKKIIYHKTCYDYATLDKLLRGVDFQRVRSYDWRKTEHAHIDDQSQAYIPHMDKTNGTLISLNVEAIK